MNLKWPPREHFRSLGRDPILFPQSMRFNQDCERGARNNLWRSQAALKLQISKRMLQEWERDRAASRGLARTAIDKAIRAWRVYTSLLAMLLYVNHV